MKVGFKSIVEKLQTCLNHYGAIEPCKNNAPAIG